MTPDDLLAGRPLPTAVFAAVLDVVEPLGGVEVRTTRSQIAFRRRRGFAFLWLPGQYLTRPDAEIVLTIALGRHVESPRFKEVAHPSPRQWIHHLEVYDPAEVDAEVAGWLAEAADRAR